jgi:hypothetical protein
MMSMSSILQHLGWPRRDAFPAKEIFCRIRIGGSGVRL